MGDEDHAHLRALLAQVGPEVAARIDPVYASESLQDTLTLTERIEINGGLRLDNYHTKYDSATACGAGGRACNTSADRYKHRSCSR